MRLTCLIALAMIAPAAFAQTQDRPQRQKAPAPIPTVLPAQTAPADKPAYLEDAVIIDQKLRNKNADSKIPIYRKSADPYADLPADMADKLRQADAEKRQGKQQYFKKTAEPMLSPDGQELVGVVENRYLTKDQLKKRVDLLMKGMPSPDDSLKKKTGIVIESNPQSDQQREEDRRILLEGRVLDDWAHITTLAVHAEHAAAAEDPSLRVTDAEINQAIQKLSAEAQVDASKIPVAMQSVMFSERELRQEVRDSLMVEKFMHNLVVRSYSGNLKGLYEKSPEAFIEPTKVHAWDLFVPKVAGATKAQLSKLKDELGSWRGNLNRAENDKEFKELGERIQKETQLILSDMGFVLSTDILGPEVKQTIFSLAVGKTSKVIETPDGFHVLKVVERKEGEKPSFETAKPHIIDYLTDKLRDPLYEQIKGKYGVRMAAGGLKKWTVIGPAEDPAAPVTKTAQPVPQAAPAAAAPTNQSPAPVTAENEPSLEKLRQSGYLQRGRGPSSNVPSVQSVVGQPPVKPKGPNVPSVESVLGRGAVQSRPPATSTPAQ